MMEALGRLFTVAPIAAGTLISLKDAAGITFVCTGNDTFSLVSASTYNGSTTALSAIARYYKSTSTAGAVAYTDSGDITPVSSVTIASGTVVFFVDAADLPTGAQYVEVSVAASGLVMAIPHDLTTQRQPKNLRVLSGSTS